MYCPSVDSLFLRANGDFVCWDDAGSDNILQRYNPDMNMSRILSESGPCSMISKKLAGNVLPFPEICPGCYCLSLRGASRFNSHWLSIMQVEPSSRCTLLCKACATLEEREKLRPPHTLPYSTFNKAMQDFTGNGIDISTFDFSGHGEPLMNPDLWRMVGIAREHYPASYISLITNGHGEFKEECISAGLDQIQFSIDGVDQESYEKYRVKGNFSKASGYMKSFARAVRSSGSPVRVIWRYILFEHDDNPDHLRAAFEMATEFGVHELQFIFTHKGMWSTRLTTASELRRELIEVGVPTGSIRMDSFNSLRARRHLSQLLKVNHNLHRTARKLWRIVKRNPVRNTIVTSDFYQLREIELQKFLDLGYSMLRKGRLRDAEAMFLHVNRMLQSPATHNRTYDPETVRNNLGCSYRRLKIALDGHSTENEV